MTISVQQVSNTSTFYFWKSQTNLLADAMSNYVVTTNSGTATGNAEISGTFTANSISVKGLSVNGYSTIKGVFANGSPGTGGQVLTSNGTSTYWSSVIGSITSISTGGGITGGPITSTGTVSLDIYTGTNLNNTVYPVGSVVSVYTGSIVKTLNSQDNIYLQNLNGVEGDGPPSTILAGTWSNRGLSGTEYRSPSDIRKYYLYQRVL